MATIGKWTVAIFGCVAVFALLKLCFQYAGYPVDHHSADFWGGAAFAVINAAIFGAVLK